MKAVSSFALFVLGVSLVACGPGRQAAWERKAADQQTAAAPEVAEDEIGAKLEAANEAWSKRSDRAELERAIALWEEASEARPNDALVWTNISRACHLLGDGFMRLAGESDAMLAVLEKGVLAGEKAMMASSEEFAKAVEGGEKVEKAVQLIPKEGQDAIYWYAANLGKFAVAKGFTTTLFYKDRIYAVMQHVLALDEGYLHAAPHRYFGAFYAKAPSFAGGDMNKSKEHFDRALELDDRYFATKVLYAEYYALKKEDEELFTRLLQAVIDTDPAVLPDYVPEQEMEQAKARDMLARKSDLF